MVGWVFFSRGNMVGWVDVYMCITSLLVNTICNKYMCQDLRDFKMEFKLGFLIDCNLAE